MRVGVEPSRATRMAAGACQAVIGLETNHGGVNKAEGWDAERKASQSAIVDSPCHWRKGEVIGLFDM